MKITTGHIIALGAFALLPLSILAPHGIALLLPMAAILASITQWLKKAPFTLPSRYWLLGLGLFHLWMFASVMWAPLPFVSLQYALKVALTSVWGILLLMIIEGLDEGEQKIVMRAFLWGGITTIGVAILCIASTFFMDDLIKENREVINLEKLSLVSLNRTSSLLSLFVWLGLYFLYKQNKPIWVRVLFFIIPAFLIFSLESFAAITALGIGSFFWFAIRTNFFVHHIGITDEKFYLRKIAGAITIALFMVTPFGIHDKGLPERTIDKTILQQKHSFDHRLFIWYDLSNHIYEKPYIGHGFSSTRYMRSPVLYPQTVKAGFQVPTHPHNAPIEVWSDLGGICAILVSLITLFIPSGISSMPDKRLRSVLFALFISAIILCSVSFGFWQSWWLSTLWFFGCLARVGYKKSLLELPKLQRTNL